jgi:dihydrofolate reductase
VRRVVATLFASVDGYASDAPDERMLWVAHGEETTAFGLAGLRAADTLVLGRVAYELFAGYWPSAGEEEGDFARRINDMPKVVVSHTLKDEDLTWSNTRLARGDLADEIAALKREPGRDIALSGSVDLVASLMELGLIVESTVLDGRVVVLDYQPLPADGGGNSRKEDDELQAR